VSTRLILLAYLAFAVLVLGLAALTTGCTAVEQADVQYSAVEPGHLRAYDLRTGDTWWKRMLSHPHRVYAWRDCSGSASGACDRGNLHDPVGEEATGSDLIEEMGQPLNWLNNHATVPVN
jgi:hypothetical protein